MKEETARSIANLVVAAAAVGAAVVILRTPALRRLAAGLTRTAITVGIPAWLSREVREAWAESRETPNADVRGQSADVGVLTSSL